MIKKFIRKFLRKDNDQDYLDQLLNNGLTIGRNFHMLRECIIDWSHCWLITIGDNVTLAPRVHILAHDASTKIFLGYTKIAKVKIGNNVFIGAGSIILPSVTIGDNVIIGAGSVVTKDIPSNNVAVGNPARVICTLENYLEKNKATMHTAPIYGGEFTLGKISNGMKERMNKDLENMVGYIE